MKKSDIAMVVLIASISMLIAFFGTRAIFGDFTGGNERVQTVDPISTEIEEPDPAIFNSNAINPAVEVQVGTGSQ